MATYAYKARDKNGELLSAAVEAEGEVEVAANLRSLGYSVVSIRRKNPFKTAVENLWQRMRKTHQRELVFFSRQLALLLRSGISLTAGLSSIAEQTDNRALREAISAILKDVERGSSFSKALAGYPHIFGDLFVSMVGAGEASGSLDEILERLASLKDQELEVRMRVRSAMTYPAILVGVAVIIVGFLLVNIVPKFVVIFETYEARLPMATQMLLWVSLIARKLWLPLLIAAAAAGFWFRLYLRSQRGRYNFDRLILRLPVFGELCLKVIVTRFSRTLSGLIRSGIPMLEALRVTEKTVGNSVISRIILNISSAITEGQPLTEPFRASGVFPATVVQMVSLGEKSGQLDRMLSEVAAFYEREVDYAIKNITTALEPLLLLAMGIMVAFIALSVLLPIFNLINVFRR